MGLAAPRKRRKLGHDPNNTAWTRATDSYGQKILASQGWVPGNSLGAKHATHIDRDSSGSGTPIRASLKDDNLGLGAQKVAAEDSASLGMFQDLLARLNGKSEAQIEEQQQKRADLGRKLYVGQRYGIARFIKGGYLVGETEKPDLDGGSRTEESTAVPSPALPIIDATSPIDPAMGDDSDTTIRTKKQKRKKDKTDKKDKDKKIKKKKRSHRASPKVSLAAGTMVSDEDFNASTLAKKRRRQFDTAREQRKHGGKCLGAALNATNSHSLSSAASKASHKAKSTKVVLSDSCGGQGEGEIGLSSKPRPENTEKKARRAEEDLDRKKEKRKPALLSSARLAASFVEPNPTITPVAVQASRTTQLNRHSVRQRFIAQKRRILQDPQALKEILMS